MTYLSFTFDDGFLTHYDVAKELYRRDIMSTFFIITGLQEYNSRSLLLSKPLLVRDIADMGHEIGSHAHTHKELTNIPVKEIEKECLNSVRTLDGVLGNSSSHYGIAYPYSSYDDQVIGVVSKYFEYGRTMGRVNRWNEVLDSYRIGSMGIRHIIEHPTKAFKNDLKLVVLTFHQEPIATIRLLISILANTDLKMTTLFDALKGVGVLQ